MSLLIQGILFLTALWLTRWFWLRLSAQRMLNNISGPQSPSFWMGNMAEIWSPYGWDFHHELGEKYGGVVKFGALFGEKQLYVFDPKSLHQIMVKDQHIFEETDSMIRGTRVSFGEGILSSVGEQHRKQRKMLNPVFSVAHLRHMGMFFFRLSTLQTRSGLVPLFFGVGKRLQAVLESKVQNGPQEVDMLMWMARCALELVGQAGLGHSFDPLVDDTIPPYILSLKNFGTTMHRMALPAQYILPWASQIGSPKFRRFIVNMIPWKDLHTGRDITDMMYSTAVHIYNTKKAALEAGDEAVSQQISQGNDIISILMKDNDNASSADRLSEVEILGQLNTLVFAATDTTSSALSRALHILAQHPDAQEKLRQEIRSAQKDGVDLSYDELVSMEYLDAVCRETLRLYPPVSFLQRVARKDAILTMSTPITTVDGSMVTEIPIPADTHIMVSILAANRNPTVWGPDVLEWKPERWLSPLPKSVADAHVPGIYANLMTFNGGGRACIGFKFSQLEMKVVLCLLVERFKFSMSDGKVITWRMSSISVPVADKNSDVPQLPLKIELAK
ncbi:cytochrome P450 [Mycena alexandri]|uniref:Cytochrome P450 n=1 Tax=Mycena alexandri TaxID=1745969 RepID=A0AAD6WT79_9AGAR|nr:cytochrome P450 [Mycena alexandri]